MKFDKILTSPAKKNIFIKKLIISIDKILQMRYPKKEKSIVTRLEAGLHCLIIQSLN